MRVCGTVSQDCILQTDQTCQTVQVTSIGLQIKNSRYSPADAGRYAFGLTDAVFDEFFAPFCGPIGFSSSLEIRVSDLANPLFFEFADPVPQFGGALEFLPVHRPSQLALQFFQLRQRPVFLDLVGKFLQCA